MLYTRCDGRDNTKKLCGFISIAIPQKKIVRPDVNQQKHTQKIQSLNLIKNNASIMTAVTVIIISLITNKKIAIILIAITKKDYHNNNNSNNNNNSDDN